MRQLVTRIFPSLFAVAGLLAALAALTACPPPSEGEGEGESNSEDAPS
jgi:hypothetical protein